MTAAYADVPAALAAVRDSHAHFATKLAFEFLVLTAANVAFGIPNRCELGLCRWKSRCEDALGTL